MVDAFDTTNTDAALAGSGITLPRLGTYAGVLWDFWRRRLDPAAQAKGNLGRAVSGRTVMITGGSSGIGRATALKVAAAGGIPLIVARGTEALEATKAEIVKAGGTAFISSRRSLRHRGLPAARERGDRGAWRRRRARQQRRSLDPPLGRSIRRPVPRLRAYDAAQYFGAVALILALLPPMRAPERGHIVNVSSIGVQTYPPRFGTYVASKAALDTFSRCIASEVHADKVRLTTVHMPLVRTPMIAPTSIYRSFPTLSPEEAANLICLAIAQQPKRVSTPVGILAQFTGVIAPDIQDRVLNMAYQIFPESPAARGEERPKEAIDPAVNFVPGESRADRPERQELSLPAKAMVQLLRGIHW